MADDPQYSTEDLAYVEIGWKDNSDQKWRSATLVVDVKIGFLEETCDMKAYHYKLNDGRHRFRRIIHPTHLVGPKIYGQLLMAALLGQYHVLSVTKKSLYRRNEDLKKISLFPLFSAITTLKMEEDLALRKRIPGLFDTIKDAFVAYQKDFRLSLHDCYRLLERLMNAPEVAAKQMIRCIVFQYRAPNLQWELKKIYCYARMFQNEPRMKEAIGYVNENYGGRIHESVIEDEYSLDELNDAAEKGRLDYEGSGIYRTNDNFVNPEAPRLPVPPTTAYVERLPKPINALQRGLGVTHEQSTQRAERADSGVARGPTAGYSTRENLGTAGQGPEVGYPARENLGTARGGPESDYYSIRDNLGTAWRRPDLPYHSGRENLGTARGGPEVPYYTNRENLGTARRGPWAPQEPFDSDTDLDEENEEEDRAGDYPWAFAIPTTTSGESGATQQFEDIHPNNILEEQEYAYLRVVPAKSESDEESQSDEEFESGEESGDSSAEEA